VNSLVEQSGLAYAMTRAYHAWISTQPQLILDLWDDRGLDEQATGAGLLVEPARSPSFERAGSPHSNGPGRMSLEDTHGRGHGGEL
jgi:hypothetical protein